MVAQTHLQDRRLGTFMSDPGDSLMTTIAHNVGIFEAAVTRRMGQALAAIAAFDRATETLAASGRGGRNHSASHRRNPRDPAPAATQQNPVQVSSSNPQV